MQKPCLVMTCLILGASLLTACSSGPVTKDAEPATSAAELPPTSFEFSPERYPAVHAAAVETLRSQGFRIARNDYRFGAITTYPRESATVAEFWLDDATTVSQGASDTLNAQQRTARIRVKGFDITQPLAIAIDPEADPPAYTLTVEVVIERLQNPDRYLTNSASNQATASYSETPGHLRPRGINGPFAQRIGRDTLLESRLLESILSALVVETPSQPEVIPEPKTESADPEPAQPEPATDQQTEPELDFADQLKQMIAKNPGKLEPEYDLATALIQILSHDPFTEEQKAENPDRVKMHRVEQIDDFEQMSGILENRLNVLLERDPNQQSVIQLQEWLEALQSDLEPQGE